MSNNCGIPAQWEQQTGLLITWPHWPEDDTTQASSWCAVEESLRHLVSLVAPYQPIIIACHDAELIGRLAIELGDIMGDLRFFHAPNNNIWVRDYGPISCHREGTLDFLDFQFNGWGNLQPYELDNRLTAQLDEQCVFQANLVYQNFVLEGGSLDSDGLGTLLCSSHRLSHVNRNPDYNRSEIETYLCKHTTAKRLLWLEQAGNGSIAKSVRFSSADTLIYSTCNDPIDEQYLASQALRTELESLRTSDGQAYNLVALPLPQAIHNENKQRLSASYTDFLITNQHVFVPQFGDNNDAIAVEQLQSLFADKQVVGIDSLALLHQGGSIHSATMNLFADITY